MQGSEEQSGPVRAKVALVDPATMSVVWMNEAASADLPDPGSVPGAPIDDALPMTGAVGVPDAVRSVAACGQAVSLHTKLVSTTKGSLTIATSVYRLPDSMVLVVTENAWQSGRETAAEPGTRSGPRRGRPGRG